MSTFKKFNSVNALIKDHNSEERVERTAAGKSILDVRTTIFENSKEDIVAFRSTPMKRLRVKSNFARSKTLVLGPRSELVLHFDHSGTASMAANLRPIMDDVMRSRPGRFTILADEATPVVASVELQEKLSKEVETLLETLKQERAEEESGEDDEEEEASSDDDEPSDEEPPIKLSKEDE